jgi:hypothetical protein
MCDFDIDLGGRTDAASRGAPRVFSVGRLVIAPVISTGLSGRA